MEIFNREISIRDYVCGPSGGYSCGNTRINLYISASSSCPAHCAFCPGYDSKQSLPDIEKLKVVLKELHDKNVINRISITGGEPCLDLPSLDNIVKAICDVCGNKTYHISINTNGANLSRLPQISHFDALDDVHISRHSDNDNENDKIFGIKTPTIEQIKRIISECKKSTFSFSCNLLKGYIDSVSKLKSYLDVALDTGIYQVGFVSLFDKTSACKKLFVEYEDISLNLLASDGFLFDTLAKDMNSCRCENFFYFSDHKVIPFYMRRLIEGQSNCVKSFVFNSENNLVANFNKGMILI